MQIGARIGEGRTAEVYAWGSDRILKLYQASFPAQAVEHEYRMTRAAQAAGVPVPAADELVEVEGRRGIVFERLQGPSLLQVMGAQPWRLFGLASRMGELHAQVHGCQVPAEMPAQFQQIEMGLRAAKGLPEPLLEACLARLAELPRGDGLCHGDFHPGNILMTPRGPVIIDWMTGTRGSPLADVCRTAVIIETSELPPGTQLALRLLVNASRRLIIGLYTRRYLRCRPAPREQINAWRAPLLAARLREVEAYPNEKKLLLEMIPAALQKK